MFLLFRLFELVLGLFVLLDSALCDSCCCLPEVRGLAPSPSRESCIVDMRFENSLGAAWIMISDSKGDF